MEQLANDGIWIPNDAELRAGLTSAGPWATTAHSPQVYNQLKCFSGEKHRAFSLQRDRLPNSQFKEQEVLFFGLVDINQLEDIGMLHPGEDVSETQDRKRLMPWVSQEVTSETLTHLERRCKALSFDEQCSSTSWKPRAGKTKSNCYQGNQSNLLLLLFCK